MPLHVGSLVATLELDRGKFQRDLAEGKDAFAELSIKAEMAGRQTARQFTQISAEAKKLGDAVVAASEKGLAARNREIDTAEKVRRAEVDLQRVQRSSDTEKVRRATENLAKARRDHETATIAATKAEEKGVQAIKDFAAAAQRAESAHDQLGARVASKNPFAALSDHAKTAGNDMAEGMAGALPGPLRAAVGKGGPVAGAILSVAAVGLMAGKMLADNIARGMEIQAQANLSAAKFGWTPEQAATAGKAAGDAYVKGAGESIQGNRDAVGTAVQAGLLDGDATADEIQPVIENLSTVAKVVGEDIPAVARSAGQAVRNGLVKNSAEAFDLLVAAQRNSLNVSGDLLDSFNEYSTILRSIGLNGQEGWALVAQGVKGGARDTDVVIDALKEFKLRATDGTAAAAKGFDALKIPADQFSAAMNAGGQASRDMMATALRNLNAIKDPAEKNAAALALFGTKFEDIQGAAFKLNLDTAVSQFGAVAGSVGQAQDKLGGAAADFENAKRGIAKAASDIQVKLAEAFGPAVSEMANFLGDNIDGITDAVKFLVGGVTFAGGVFTSVFGGLIWAAGNATKVIAGLIEAFIRSQAAAGALLSKIPGMGDLGRSIQDSANKAADMAAKVREGGNAAADLGGKMAGAGFKIAEAGGKMAVTGSETRSATEAFNNLGIKVRETPDGKRIEITENTPEVKKRLEDLRFKVQTMPDGSFYIDAQDQEAKRRISELTKTETKVIKIVSQNLSELSGGGTFVGANGARTELPPIPGAMSTLTRASGGPVYGPGTATSDSIPAMLSNGEYVVNAKQTARFGGLLHAINSGRISRFADGGAVQTAAAINSFPRSGGLEGAPYKWGGVNWGDCSGAMSAIANFAVGLAPFASRFATASEGAELARRGFKTGHGPAGSLRIGWVNGGPGGGHTAGTLPDGTNVEMGGGRGNGQVGGQAAGADDSQFTNQAYLMVGDSGETTGGGTTADGASAGATGVSAVDTKATGSGSAQNVFVTNWPEQLGGPTTTNTGSNVKFSLFANGGHVRGPGTGTSDSIPAMLSNGEFVVNAAATAKNRPLLSVINNGGIPRFAAGGFVAPKIEAPKLMPGGPLPLPGDTGVGTPQLADSQAPAATFNPAKYNQERLMQLGVDMIGVLKNAASEQFGEMPSILTNSIGLAKSIGSGIESSQQNQRDTTQSSTTTTGEGGQIVNNYNTTINATNTDDAFRQWQTKQNRDALAFEGKIP